MVKFMRRERGEERTMTHLFLVKTYLPRGTTSGDKVVHTGYDSGVVYSLIAAAGIFKPNECAVPIIRFRFHWKIYVMLFCIPKNKKEILGNEIEIEPNTTSDCPTGNDAITRRCIRLYVPSLSDCFVLDDCLSNTVGCGIAMFHFSPKYQTNFTIGKIQVLIKTS